MLPPRVEVSRRFGRWLLPAALLALTPKCLVCVLAYAGLGAALGMGGPELCGVTAASPAAWAFTLAWLGGAGGLGAVGLRASRRSRRPTATRGPQSGEP